MRIISDFHDYYDCIMRQGIDPTIIYHRKARRTSNRRRRLYWPTMIKPIPCILYFCGRRYRFYDIRTDDVGARRAYCYTADEVRNFIKSHYSKAALAAYDEPYRMGGGWNSGKRPWRILRREVEAHFSGDGSIGPLRERDEKLHRDLGSPIILYHYTKGVFADPCLKDIEFMRVIDPYTAFQEIQMYLGSILAAGEKMVPDVSDADLASAKGFDKSSFRKERQKKK